MAEMMMFQPGTAFMDAYNKGRTNSLAKLAMTDPSQRKSALGELAGINPDAARTLQSDFDEKDKADFSEWAGTLLNVAPEIQPQVYQAGLSRWGEKFRRMGVEPPADYKQALPAIQQWAGMGNKGKYTGAPIIVQTENGPKYARYSDSGIELTQFAPDDRFTMNVDADGNVRGYNTRRNVLAPTADASAPQPVQQGDDPMAPYLERIRMGGEVLASNNVPVDQINAWKDAEFAKAQQQLAANGVQVTQPAPQPARVAVKDQGQITPYQEETLRLQREAAARAEAEAAAKAAERKAAADAKAQERQARVESAQATTGNLLDNIRQLKKHPGFKDLGTLGGNVADSALPEYVPTQYRGAKARLETIKGQIALQAMAELKALSNTGATGFGALAVPELTLLQNSIQTLTTSQENGDIMAALDQIEKLLTKAKSGQRPPAQPPAGGQGKSNYSSLWGD